MKHHPIRPLAILVRTAVILGMTALPAHASVEPVLVCNQLHPGSSLASFCEWRSPLTPQEVEQRRLQRAEWPTPEEWWDQVLEAALNFPAAEPKCWDGGENGGEATRIPGCVDTPPELLPKDQEMKQMPLCTWTDDGDPMEIPCWQEDGTVDVASLPDA